MFLELWNRLIARKAIADRRRKAIGDQSDLAHIVRLLDEAPVEAETEIDETDKRSSDQK